MNIQINDNWRLIRSDALNITLERRHILGTGTRGRKPAENRMGEEKWIPVGYYSNLRDAALGALRHMASHAEAASLEELLRAIRESETRLSEVVTQMSA